MCVFAENRSLFLGDGFIVVGSPKVRSYALQPPYWKVAKKLVTFFKADTKTDRFWGGGRGAQQIRYIFKSGGLVSTRPFSERNKETSGSEKKIVFCLVCLKRKGNATLSCLLFVIFQSLPCADGKQRMTYGVYRW